MTYWVVVDIGCIECGGQTRIITVQTDWQAAHAILAAEKQRLLARDLEGNQTEFEYFDGDQHVVALYEVT